MGDAVVRTKGQVEAALAASLTRFEREWLGRGPRECRIAIVEDAVLARLRGVLSPAEQELAGQTGGVALIKELRNRLVEAARQELAKMVEQEVGSVVIAMHTDLSIPTGERIFLFVCDQTLEGRWPE